MTDATKKDGAIHDSEPARHMTMGMAAVLTEPPFGLCGKCVVRGIALALHDALRAATAADAKFGGELKREVLAIVSGDVATLLRENGTVQ